MKTSSDPEPQDWAGTPEEESEASPEHLGKNPEFGNARPGYISASIGFFLFCLFNEEGKLLSIELEEPSGQEVEDTKQPMWAGCFFLLPG